MAIPAVDGAVQLLRALDGLVARPVRGRRLPVVVLEDAVPEGAAPLGRAKGFVAGYHERLWGEGPEEERVSFLPHAFLDRERLARIAAAAEPGTALLDDLADQFRSTMPRRTGKLRLPLYQTCRDVLDAPQTGTNHQERRAEMARHLDEKWEERVPVLKDLRAAVEGEAGGAQPWIAAVLAFLLSWPLRQCHRLALNRRRLRWYARRVSTAGLPARTFTDAATRLREFRETDGERQAVLGESLLLEALLADLSRAVRRGRFLPGRRRRTWGFALLLTDLDAPGGRLAQRLLDLHADLVRRGVRPPVLVMAAYGEPPADAAADGAPRLDVREAAVRLGGAADGTAERIVVRVPDGPEYPERAPLLGVDKVSPPRVSWPVAHAGWLVPVLAMAVGGHPAIVCLTDVLAGDACPAIEQVGGERVGIDTASDGCYFTAAGTLLGRLQDQVRKQNAEIEDDPHRTLVFFGPLTANPEDEREQLLPSGVLQLQGAVEAQREWNAQADISTHMPKLRLLVANAGFAFGEGERVADRIRELVEEDDTFSAVIGIAQSRRESVDAINRLDRRTPVIGASVTGDFMADDARNFFHTQATNAVMAEVMVRRAAGLKATRAVIVHDDTDLYSRELRRKLSGELRKRGIPVENPSYAEIPFPTSENEHTIALRLPQLARRICDLPAQGGITLYAARGTQLPKVLAEVQRTCGREHAGRRAIPVIGSDVNTLIEYRDLPEWARIHRYTAVDLYYISFSDRPVLGAPEGGSDHTSGGDALRAAAAAVLQASTHSSGDASPSNVLQELRREVEVRGGGDPERDFTLPLDEERKRGRPVFLCLAPHDETTDSHDRCVRGGRGGGGGDGE
ncbi:MAG TPA: ABC transporter substrate-binding protein [Streptomyces sp.]|uniref:ABC transporter substrate-binding protein n=1 Tax=Streptomyces sp. TaxID=1931 RepID=UPI002D66F98A|nr:ABC transporter substrate-binding protein [Streptomyces sp.]HZG07323.1 ABC transporter substrate-binding protein [Streptomyces sp.]